MASNTLQFASAVRPTVPTPDLPPGVRFYELTGFAESWEAYFALTTHRGWAEGRRGGSRWKRRAHYDGSIVVHPPTPGSAS